MQTRLWVVILLGVLSQAPGKVSAQNTLQIIGAHTKVSGTLKEVNAIMVINRENVAGKKNEEITVTREVDAASPQLYQLCATNEVLSQVIFKVYKPGDLSRYKLITIRNALLTKINGQRVTGPVGKEGAAKKSTTEMLTFTFLQIEITYNLNNSVSTSDDWTANNQ